MPGLVADGGLGEREDQVMELVANGLSNREIGKALFVSEETVKTHVKNALQKLGARNRTHAVALWLLHGDLSRLMEASGPPGNEL